VQLACLGKEAFTVNYNEIDEQNSDHHAKVGVRLTVGVRIHSEEKNLKGSFTLACALHALSKKGASEIFRSGLDSSPSSQASASHC
jgi:hypothetical protein